MRQREDDDVVAGQRLERGRLDDAVREREQMGLEGAERLAGARGPGQRAHAHARVSQQQSQHLAAGVPARAGDRHGDVRHLHDYTCDM